MKGAPNGKDEFARLLALARYEILDTLPELAFDRATRLAAQLLGTPVAFINFVDQDRQWTKAAVGVPDTHAPRADSLCAWTILQDGPLVIPDTRADPRFVDNPFVTGDPPIRMYAGAPLITPGGHRIGTLCVSDTVVHPLGAAELRALQDLAAMVMTELELRVASLHLNRSLGAQTQANAELRRTLDQANVLEGVSGLMELDLTPEELTLAAAALLSEAVASDSTSLIVFEGETLRVEAAHSHPRLSPAQRLIPGQLPDWPGSVTRELRHASEPLYLDDYPGHPAALPEVVEAGIVQLAWLPLGTHGGVTSLLMAARMLDNPVPSWRHSDRALLEAAGRAIQAALDRRALTDAARQQARQDALTGLLNRRALGEDIHLRRALGEPFAAVLLDLDGFKRINDQDGHAAGDQVLRTFAGTLAAALDSSAALYRLGGDEFVALLPPGALSFFPEQLEAAVLAAQQVAGLLGASSGVAHSWEVGSPEVGDPQDGSAGADTAGLDGAALLALADARMYAAKQRRGVVLPG